MPGQNNPQRDTRILQGLVGVTLISILIFIIGDVFNLFDKIVNLIRNQDNLPLPDVFQD